MNPEPPEILSNLFLQLCNTSSDIVHHLPRLYWIARECSHITEFGTRTGVSTSAFLSAQPKKIICYDLVKMPEVDTLIKISGNTEFIFKEENTLTAEIEPTDLLFIDSYHVYDQIKVELKQAPKVKKYIAMHDTAICGTMGEDKIEGHGLGKAIGEFLQENEKEWEIQAIYFDSCGMIVLKRKENVQ